MFNSLTRREKNQFAISTIDFFNNGMPYKKYDLVKKHLLKT